MKFMTTLIVVESIEKSRDFYERIMGLKVTMDFGQNVTFEDAFAIHLQSHFQSLLGDGKKYPISKKTNNAELYFETDDMPELRKKFVEESIEMIHDIREQPWGQLVMRFYDPDGHIIEVGETMKSLTGRLYKDGMDAEAISKRTSLPLEYVKILIQTSA